MRIKQLQSVVHSKVRIFSAKGRYASCVLANGNLVACLKIALVFILLLLLSSGHGFAQDTSCFIIWYPAVQVSDSNYEGTRPRIALTGSDTIHITWRGSPSAYRLPYTRSVTDGRSWETIRDLVTDTLEFPVGFNDIALVAEGQKVYVFANNEYESHISQPEENAIAKSVTGGTTWEPLKRVGPDSAAGMWSASVHNETLVIVYGAWRNGSYAEDREIYSTDGGATWTRTNDTLDSWTRTAIVGGTLHLVRETLINNAAEKLYLRSNDLGNSFPHSEILSLVDGRNGFEHDLAANISETNTTMVLVWRETRFGCIGAGVGCSIVMRESHDNGNTWSSEETISEQLGGSGPAVALGDGRLAMAWTEENESGNVFNPVVRIRDSSGTWSTTHYMTDNGYGGSVDVGLSSNAIHVVWSELVGGNLGTWRIFYRLGVFTNVNATNTPVKYESGWNLVSLPVLTDSVYKLPSLFRYDGSYVSSDSMVAGVGYWSKPDSQFRYYGSFMSEETVDVKLGWNIIGSLSCPVHISNVKTMPSGIIVSEFYGYRNGAYYQSELIEPGRAYWIKVSQAGKLVLNAK